MSDEQMIVLDDLNGPSIWGRNGWWGVVVRSSFAGTECWLAKRGGKGNPASVMLICLASWFWMRKAKDHHNLCTNKFAPKGHTFGNLLGWASWAYFWGGLAVNCGEAICTNSVRCFSCACLKIFKAYEFHHRVMNFYLVVVFSHHHRRKQHPHRRWFSFLLYLFSCLTIVPILSMWGFPKIVGKTPKMDGWFIMENPMSKWMIWGEFSRYFRKHP